MGNRLYCIPAKSRSSSGIGVLTSAPTIRVRGIIASWTFRWVNRKRFFRIHALLALELTAALAFGDERANLFGREDVPMAPRRDSENAEDQVPRAV
jgi:hypothetical protein